jgi:hypothetical protein
MRTATKAAVLTLAVVGGAAYQPQRVKTAAPARRPTFVSLGAATDADFDMTVLEKMSGARAVITRVQECGAIEMLCARDERMVAELGRAGACEAVIAVMTVWGKDRQVAAAARAAGVALAGSRDNLQRLGALGFFDLATEFDLLELIVEV